MPAATAAKPAYDQELQMFIDPKRELRMSHLGFYRWLAERTGRAVSDSHGEAAGEKPLDTRMGPTRVPAALAASIPDAPKLGRDFHTHHPNCCPTCALEQYNDEDEGKVPA